MGARVNVKAQSLEELQSFFREIGEPAYRGTQLFGWVWQKGVSEFSLCSNFSKKLRECLESNFYIGTLSLDTVVSSGDGAAKYVFQRERGQRVESVFIPSSGRKTVCCSRTEMN